MYIYIINLVLIVVGSVDLYITIENGLIITFKLMITMWISPLFVV